MASTTRLPLPSLKLGLTQGALGHLTSLLPPAGLLSFAYIWIWHLSCFSLFCLQVCLWHHHWSTSRRHRGKVEGRLEQGNHGEGTPTRESIHWQIGGVGLKRGEGPGIPESPSHSSNGIQVPLQILCQILYINYVTTK